MSASSNFKVNNEKVSPSHTLNLSSHSSAFFFYFSGFTCLDLVYLDDPHLKVLNFNHICKNLLPWNVTCSHGLEIRPWVFWGGSIPQRSKRDMISMCGLLWDKWRNGNIRVPVSCLWIWKNLNEVHPLSGELISCSPHYTSVKNLSCSAQNYFQLQPHKLVHKGVCNQDATSLVKESKCTLWAHKYL